MKNSRRRNFKKARDTWIDEVTFTEPGLDKDDVLDSQMLETFTHNLLQRLSGLVMQGEPVPTAIIGVAPTGRSVVLADGPVHDDPTIGHRVRGNMAMLRGSVMDNVAVVRQIFARLGVVGAVLAGEAWSGEAHVPEGTSLARGQSRCSALGRTEALLIDAAFPTLGYRRLIVSPIVRTDWGVVCTPTVDSHARDGDIEAVTSAAEKFLPQGT